MEVTDIGISALAHGCPLLRSINLDCCDNITDIGLLALADSCPLLDNISLSECNRITDVGVSAIAHGCPFLTSIFLDCDENVTVISISALALNCRCLRVLELVSEGICHDFLDGLRRDHPRLKIKILRIYMTRRFHLYN